MHEEFEFEGRTLEIRADPSPNKAVWTIRVVHNGRPATATAYTVSYLTMLDTQLPIHAEVVKELMATARRAVERKWDALIVEPPESHRLG
jgi:hypothetical protein